MFSAYFGGLVMGMICGCVPLFYGVFKNQLAFALTGFMACTVSGFMLGALLALPMSAVFCYIIRMPPAKPH